MKKRKKLVSILIVYTVFVSFIAFSNLGGLGDKLGLTYPYSYRNTSRRIRGDFRTITRVDATTYLAYIIIGILVMGKKLIAGGRCY